jgi:hypothetical protein
VVAPPSPAAPNRPGSTGGENRCPDCGEVNPGGFVWCRRCKRNLAPAHGRALPLSILIPLAIVLGGGAVLLFGRREEERKPESGSAPSTAAPDSSRKELADSLDRWKRAADGGSGSSSGSGSGSRPGSVSPSGSGSVAPAVSPAPTTSAPAAPPRIEGIDYRHEGDRLVIEVKVRQGGEVSPVKVTGHMELSGGTMRFVADDIDIGALPIDADEIRRQLEKMTFK